MRLRMVLVLLTFLLGGVAVVAVGAAPQKPGAAPRIPRDYDRNRDGKIDKDEAAAMNEALAAAPKGMLARLDRNHDASLDDAEIAAFNKHLAKVAAQASQPRKPRPAKAPVPEDPVGTGTATITWQPPTQNADDTKLTDLKGYVIHYGRSRDSLNHRVVVSQPDATRYVVERLGEGTWYFAVSAYNSNGVESAPSEVVSKKIGK